MSGLLRIRPAAARGLFLKSHHCTQAFLLFGTELSSLLNNCITMWEVRCLRHPGASTIGSQLQDGDYTDGWQDLTTQPWFFTPPRRQAPITLIHGGKQRLGRGENKKHLNAPHIMLLLSTTLIKKPYVTKNTKFHACASIPKPLMAVGRSPSSSLTWLNFV